MGDGFDVYFDETLTSAQRGLAEQSIAFSIKRSQEAANSARAKMVEDDELRDALAAPLAKLIQADPEAAAALEKLGKRQIELQDSLRPDVTPLPTPDQTFLTIPIDRSLVYRRAPYDFAWNWHDTGGAPPFTQLGAPDGDLRLEARAGSVPGGADRRVDAHIGVGCIVRIDRPSAIDLYATRDSRHSFHMESRGVGSNATSEGGLEVSFIKGGTQVLMGGTLPLWRRRVSGFEEARDNTNFSQGSYPNGLGGRVDPGEYAYNVGIRVSVDYSPGVGAAAVQAIVQSNILNMQIHWRT